MNPIEIINKKKNKIELTYDEIKFMVDGYIKGNVENYQMSSLLMAICLNGMTFEETYYLTDVMLKSGDLLDFSDIEGIKIDKHSTGGVGDKVTIALAPLVSSLGIKFPKMSGRGLGHTGGTIDKLESINGFNVKLSEERIYNSLKDVGAVICAQTKNLVPADKKLYALRDVTGTVDSIPLIASSIMSKKLASGADIILIDVKVGSGAFMKNLENAKLLAKTMVEIGNRYNKKVITSLTDMSNPLGYSVGNSLEVIEAIRTIKGEIDNEFSELIYHFASHIVSLAYNIDNKEALKMVNDSIKSGAALNKLKEIVENQDGDINYILDINKFHKAKYIIEVKSEKEGYIDNIDAFSIGKITCELGAGRLKLGDRIDHSVGIEFMKLRGEYVKQGDALFKIHSNFLDNDEYITRILNAYTFSDEKKNHKLILDTIF